MLSMPARLGVLCPLYKDHLRSMASLGESARDRVVRRLNGGMGFVFWIWYPGKDEFHVSVALAKPNPV